MQDEAATTHDEHVGGPASPDVGQVLPPSAGLRSPGQELVRLGGSLGLVADEAGRNWLRTCAGDSVPGQTAMMFRCRDGRVVELSALGGRHAAGGEVAVVVVEGAAVHPPD
jgi:hypothetical protein